MGTRSFEPKAGWKSPIDDVVNGFYRPALKECIRYDRLTGFFNSNTFAAVIHEALDFVERGGRIRLITGSSFSKADLEVITKSMEDRLSEEVSDILEDELGKKCLAVFGHMLTNKIDGAPQLEIKILVPERGIFHPKVGVFNMLNGDTISFAGSVNETGRGWTDNVEEFKVFCSWVDKKYVNIDIGTFKEFWHGSHVGIQTYNLPDAVRAKILAVRPSSDEEYRELVEDLRTTIYCDADAGSRSQKKFKLHYYQKDAIMAWVSNDYKGILEMPTATGKTFTAMGCINTMQRNRGRLFTVIVAPYRHLVKQWVDNISKWNSMTSPEFHVSAKIMMTSDNPKWKEHFRRAIVEFNKKKIGGGYVTEDAIVCTTYKTFSRNEFTDTIAEIEGNVLLVTDEAHNVGSIMHRAGLIKKYVGRLALTATPERYFDEDGSKKIQSYFGKTVYSMDIGQAIKEKYLVPYDYYPVFAELNPVELKEYRRLTQAIRIKLSKNNDVEHVINNMNSPENKRARLIAKIEQKYDKLEIILNKHNNRLQDTLIYCHDGEQLRRVGGILGERNINYDEVTSSSSMIERWNRIQSLEKKHHQCIVAMKCLDEGVDIPSARLGIIMASTGNPLQYIQRRGRLLRLLEGKDHASIYDILAVPPPDVDDQPYAKKLVAKELLRHREFAQHARNSDEANNMIRQVADRFGINLGQLKDITS